MKTRANRLALYLSVGATASLAGPAVALADSPPAVPALPVQPCLASSSLPAANPLPCPAASSTTPAPASGTNGSGGASGSAGANGSGTPGAATTVQGQVKVKARPVRHRRHAKRHARRRHRVRHHR
jgi:hypothetical protein